MTREIGISDKMSQYLETKRSFNITYKLYELVFAERNKIIIDQFLLFFNVGYRQRDDLSIINFLILINNQMQKMPTSFICTVVPGSVFNIDITSDLTN